MELCLAYAGFGLTFAIDPVPGKLPAVGCLARTFWWWQGNGTSSRIDPKEHMIGVFLINILPPNNNAAGGRRRMAVTGVGRLAASICSACSLPLRRDSDGARSGC